MLDVFPVEVVLIIDIYSHLLYVWYAIRLGVRVELKEQVLK